MRIAFFLNEFPSLSQTFVLNQITGMIDRGHEVHIYAGYRFESEECHPQVQAYGLMERTRYFSDRPAGYWRRITTAIAQIVKKGVWRRPALLLRTPGAADGLRDLLRMGPVYRMLALADRDPYDIIHCQFGTLGPVALRLRDTGVTGGKIVTSFRGYDITKRADNSALIYQDLFRRGALFLPVSESLRDKLLAAGCPADKIKVLHSGIDCSLFSLTHRQISPEGVIRLLTIGRFVEKKGIEYALAAVAAARDAGFVLHYTLVGDGPLRAQLEQQIRDYGLVDSVSLPGWQNHEEVVRLMGVSHLLIAPSITAEDGDQEGIPNVVKEAMATGLPALSTWHGGIPELVDDGVTGYLVAERDVAALTEALKNFCSHPDKWAAMGARAREKIEAEFDIRRLNDELEGLYRDIAGAHPATG
jgi:colanic acid/amylovoran biosynthesis glycosyltransferase